MGVGENLSDKGKEDFDLVKKARDNDDEKAYALLMDRYRKSVFFMVYKMLNKSDEAEDLTIEIFAKAFDGKTVFAPSPVYPPQIPLTSKVGRIPTLSIVEYPDSPWTLEISRSAVYSPKSNGRFAIAVRSSTDNSLTLS